MSDKERSTPSYVWMNGAVVPWDSARVHVRSDAFMYGANVFEGVRAYRSRSTNSFNVFRCDDHLDRLFDVSMKILRITPRWTKEEVKHALVEVVRLNDFVDCVQLRPTFYFGEGKQYSFDPSQVEMGTVITGVEMPSTENTAGGLEVCISSWQRIGDNVMPPRVKAGANYLNSRYVRMEARLAGYDTAIILNPSGTVAEGPGECLMIVRRGVLITPPVTSGILESITRTTIIDLAKRELGLEVVEREVDRTELYIADEAFFCGTGAEVRPIAGVDKYRLGDGQPGPITSAIKELYFSIVRDERPAYRHWLTSVT